MIWKMKFGKTYKDMRDCIKLVIMKILDCLINNGNKIQHLKEKILKQYLSKRGYFVINLCKNGKSKTFKIHRLIAIYFIENKNNYNIINHINGIKTDKRISNLEWCTYKHNTNEAFRLGLMKPIKIKYGKESPHHTSILQYDINFKLIKKWYLLKEASEKLKINRINIINCCKSRRKTAGKFIWRYADE